MAYREAKTFTVRIELEASFDDDYEGDDDGGVWLRRWMDETRPEIATVVMKVLARGGRFVVVPRSRGASPEDELEIGVSLVTRT